MKVTIGIDPHKGSHTAVAIDTNETVLAEVRVAATPSQTDELMCWAARFDQRRWAIESAQGLGYLLSQQLVAAGEEVVDVPAVLATRVRVLSTGRSQKNDPTMPIRSRSPRCARNDWRPCRPMTTPECCDYWPNAIVISAE